MVSINIIDIISTTLLMGNIFYMFDLHWKSFFEEYYEIKTLPLMQTHSANYIFFLFCFIICIDRF